MTIMTDPITSLTESYTYDPGTNNILTTTNVNGQVTTNYYDVFKRLISVVKPGDSQSSPSITYQYNSSGNSKLPKRGNLHKNRFDTQHMVRRLLRRPGQSGTISS